MTININRRSTGSRDLLNMCHKVIRCKISQFNKRVYLALHFRAAKTQSKQQTSHYPRCSRPVLCECSSLALLPLPREHAVHSSLPSPSAVRASGFPWGLPWFPGVSPWQCLCKGLASTCKPPVFVALEKTINA